MIAETECRIAALCALAWLCGCAMVYEGKYDWDQGWRVGRVIRFGPGMTVAQPAGDDCRQQASPADMARTSYAEVAYQTEGRWLRHRVVPIPQDMAIKEGQTVYINIGTCGSLVQASGRS
ncbi:MAG: hypothetical protein E6H63_04655 [Betaproteobacteria bacterium]|nr:MAG: hypothetical protein E6H63_04655 [Betaproteobacteria bacterium]